MTDTKPVPWADNDDPVQVRSRGLILSLLPADARELLESAWTNAAPPLPHETPTEGHDDPR
jgi:hypothetical protein